MNRLARWLLLTIATGISLALIAALIAAASSVIPLTPGDEPRAVRTAVLEPALAKALATEEPGERLNVIVEMREQVTPATVVAGQTKDPSGARRRLVSALRTAAERAQADLRTYLSSRETTGDVERVTPFWIFNGLAVTGAHPDVLRDLAERPDVALIRPDHWRQWIENEPARPVPDGPSALRSTHIEWGVAQIHADQVWSRLGISGTGVIVASVDTGVDWQHPGLQSSYRGYSPKGFHQHEGNWYDATGEGAIYPVDGNGHGSHTMGTIVGAGGIGVAPGARWIAVRAFGSDGYALDSWLHAALQWLIAPNGDPDLAPQIVNNSWGNNRGTLTTFQHDLDALRAAGIFPIFSVGNSGPEPSTIGSPASLPGAFAVGASDQDDEVTSFSGRGPSPWGEIRPHVVAPGVNISSTLPGGTHGELEGTSMAAPHTAGTAALILSAQPNLNITQTASVIIGTAVPLSDIIPNNHSGYGRVDAYAAVAMAANAGLIRGRVLGGGAPLADATIRAASLVGALEGTATSDADGLYELFLGAGFYDLAVSAFGYDTTWAHAVSVITGAVTTQDFDLTPLPTGRLRGSVTSAEGDAVTARVSALGTPASTLVTDGGYQLDLPAGRYTLEARAVGYQVVTASVTLTAGQNTYQDFILPTTMRVLLVDSGAWYYQSELSYYRQALDDLSYAYDEWRVKHVPSHTPTFTDLLPYELVIWSAPEDSPGLVAAGTVISDYLASGGNLLLSGQDVAYWDGGGSGRLYPYYTDFAHSIYGADNAPSRQVVCEDAGSFNGITLTIQGGDGADNQRWPDEIEVLHPDHAWLTCSYDDGGGAVIQAGFCNSHRVLNLGFGFEAINDAAERAAFMARALDWFASPRQAAGVELLGQTEPIQVAPGGDVVTHSFRLRNLGEAGQGDQIQVALDGDAWPTTLIPFSDQLEPCGTTLIHLRVEIPAGLTWNSFDTVTLTAHSSVAPALSQTLVFTSKVPAPVLLVDDDRWFDQEQVYEDALRAADLPYDRWEVTEIFGSGSPPGEVLAWYPVVVWFNGYDWFDPIHPNELHRLTTYLDSGGRLFLSSQDALYYVGSSEFAQDYLGVISYSEVFSQTLVQGVPEHPLGDGLGPVELAYPFRNWSDSLLLAPGSHTAFRGQHGQAGAVTREGACDAPSAACRWRTAFFAFPFEALPEGVRMPLMMRSVGWLSWLGGSNLQSDRAVAGIGDIVGFTLTLRNDGPDIVRGAAVSNTLPLGTVLVRGPAGGASYVPQDRRISWLGDLSPGTAMSFTYGLSVTDGPADAPVRNIADVILSDQALHFQRHADLRIAAPDLAASSLSMAPTMAGASTEVLVTLVIRNDGLDDASNVRVDNPLPWPLRLITSTLSQDAAALESGGAGITIELPQGNRILWEGEVTVDAPVTLTYRALAPPVLQDGLWVYNAALLEDGSGGAWERGRWLYVEPQRVYLPITYHKSALLDR